MIFGGYSLYLQKMGILDVAGILESQGQSAAVAAILQTLPLPKLIMIAVCVLCFIYLATTIDSCAYVLTGTTTKSIGRKEEPARWNRICWALIFCALSVGLMIIGGLQAIQSVSIIAALPLIGVMFLLILSVIKMLKEREE
ncbi:BCCT family transporter [Blautia hansenii]|uniref:BCCT family transporter n=1 Tax=Blautia hansenii TaxID=1322 RepID=UPI0039840765